MAIQSGINSLLSTPGQVAHGVASISKASESKNVKFSKKAFNTAKKRYYEQLRLKKQIKKNITSHREKLVPKGMVK